MSPLSWDSEHAHGLARELARGALCSVRDQVCRSHRCVRGSPALERKENSYEDRSAARRAGEPLTLWPDAEAPVLLLGGPTPGLCS